MIVLAVCYESGANFDSDYLQLTSWRATPR
jgi:hypothetical protein